MAVAAEMSVPTSMVPVVSMVTWTMSGSSWPRRTIGVAAAIDGGLDLQRVLAGLDQQRVRAACDQPLGLDGECGLELAVGDVAEAGQLGAGADGADDEPLAPVAGEGLDGLAGEARGTLVDLECSRLQAELAQRDRRAAEAVGLDRVGAGGKVADMDLADQLGAAEVQDLRAVLLAPIVVEREIAGLELAAHGAVEQDDMAAGEGEEIGHAAAGTACAARRWRIANGSSARFSA